MNVHFLTFPTLSGTDKIKNFIFNLKLIKNIIKYIISVPIIIVVIVNCVKCHFPQLAKKQLF